MKGQTQALTTVMVTTLIVTAAASTYMWGQPAINKQQSQLKIDNLRNKALELRDTATFIAEAGSQSSSTVGLDFSGADVYVNGKKDYIQVEADVKGSPYSSQWSNLRDSSEANTTYTPGPDPAETGSSLAPVAVKTAESGETLRFRIDFRNVQVGEGTIRRVDLETVGENRASGNVQVKLTNKGSDVVQSYRIDGEPYRLEKTVLEVDLVENGG